MALRTSGPAGVGGSWPPAGEGRCAGACGGTSESPFRAGTSTIVTRGANTLLHRRRPRARRLHDGHTGPRPRRDEPLVCGELRRRQAQLLPGRGRAVPARLHRRRQLRGQRLHRTVRRLPRGHADSLQGRRCGRPGSTPNEAPVAQPVPEKDDAQCDAVSDHLEDTLDLWAERFMAPPPTCPLGRSSRRCAWASTSRCSSVWRRPTPEVTATRALRRSRRFRGSRGPSSTRCSRNERASGSRSRSPSLGAQTALLSIPYFRRYARTWCRSMPLWRAISLTLPLQRFARPAK